MPGGGAQFLPQCVNRRRDRRGVGRHVHDRRDPACGGGARSGLKAFPLRAPRLVDVNVNIEQSRKDRKITVIVERHTGWNFGPADDPLDPPVANDDRAVALSVGRHDPRARDELLGHLAYYTAMPAKLTYHSYGKSAVRLTKVKRLPDRHELIELEVAIELSGD